MTQDMRAALAELVAAIVGFDGQAPEQWRAERYCKAISDARAALAEPQEESAAVSLMRAIKYQQEAKSARATALASPAPPEAGPVAWRPYANCGLDSTGKVTHSYGCPNDPDVFRATPQRNTEPASRETVKHDKAVALAGDMAKRFETHTGQSWTDPEWREESALWAAAWHASRSAEPAPQVERELPPLPEPSYDLQPGEPVFNADEMRAYALAARTAIPAGWQLVPVWPTEAMRKAGGFANSEWLNDNAPIGEARYATPMISVWTVMLAAAPTARETP